MIEREGSARTRPWPGPRPYDEADRDKYFGRELDGYRVLERLDAERLLLLTAPSAVGKTSFLRALVVPELRRRRLESARATDQVGAPCVLVVRDWALPVTDVDTYLGQAIVESIESLRLAAAAYPDDQRASILADYELLRAVPVDGGGYQYVSGLARAVGSLTLVLDQFEEALQGNASHLESLSLLLARLYKHVLGARMLISFREEAWIRFAAIGREVGDLTKRTYLLQALDDKVLRAAVADSAQAGSVDLDPDALSELLTWMSESRAREGSPHLSARSQQPTSRPARQLSSLASVDLLKLQAVLVQLYDAATEEPVGPRHTRITTKTLSSLCKRIAPDRDDAGVVVVDTALQRFIDQLLPLPMAVFSGDLPSDLSEIDHRVLRVRRAAARMGPSFSSGGFKVQQERAALLARSFREDWEVLNIEVDEVEEILRQSDLENDLSALFSSQLEDASEDLETGQVHPDLETRQVHPAASGVSKAGSWSPRRIAIDIIDTALTALSVLVADNVLRRKAFQDQVTYELVHDGFGAALFDWAEEARAQPLDALTATTAERGTALRWTKLTGVVRDVRWRGCWVGPDRDKSKRLAIESVVFERSDLRGTVFEDCDFRGGGFRTTDLGGVLFWGCTFERDAGGADYAFDHVVANGLNFDDQCVMTGVRFSNEARLHNMSWARVRLADVAIDRCVLNQMTVGVVGLGGDLSITNSEVLLGDLVGIESSEPTGRMRIDRCDIFYCRLGNLAQAAVDAGDDNLQFPEPAQVRREPELRSVAGMGDPWEQPSLSQVQD